MGLGAISKRIIEGIKEAEGAELYAVVSRDQERSNAVKQACGAKQAYGSYQQAWDDPAIDIVYIATANPYHYEMIKQSILHRKHVICEKPMVHSSAQLTELFALAKRHEVFLMEAEKTLFTPLNQKLKHVIDSGMIGELIAIEGTYAHPLLAETSDFNNWVFQDEFGGCSFDIGVYPICYCNYFANSSILHIQTKKRYRQFKNDVHIQGMLVYANGIIANFTASWIQSKDNVGYLYGTSGYIKTTNFWKNNEAELVLNDGTKTRIQVDKTSDFKGEIEHVITCIEQGLLESPILGYNETKAILDVVLNEVGLYE